MEQNLSKNDTICLNRYLVSTGVHMHDTYEECDQEQHFLEVSVDTRNAEWPFTWSKEGPEPFWPLENARLLCTATRDWSTYKEAQRHLLKNGLWAGFNQLIKPHGAWDANEINSASWQPLDVKLGHFEMRSKDGQFKISFDFDFTKPKNINNKLRVQQVVITYAGPAKMLRRLKGEHKYGNGWM
jgi:hypothetical protein